ncbi:MAG: recombination protein RecA [Verrucomicrobiota bacterium]
MQSKLVDLRNLLAERFPQSVLSSASFLTTGLRPLDQVTGGGLPKGAITELISPHPSAGTGLLIYSLLETAQRNRFFLALIDGRDSFDPGGPGQVRLRHLLWVRCRQALEAVKAADLLLRDGNFPLVILDLVLNGMNELRKIPQTTWYRLQRLVESAPSAFLVLARHSVVSSAQIKLVLENRWALPDLEQDRHTPRLTFRVQRVQGARQQLESAG